MVMILDRDQTVSGMCLTVVVLMAKGVSKVGGLIDPPIVVWILGKGLPFLALFGLY